MDDGQRRTEKAYVRMQEFLVARLLQLPARPSAARQSQTICNQHAAAVAVHTRERVGQQC